MLWEEESLKKKKKRSGDEVEKEKKGTQSSWDSGLNYGSKADNL